MLKIKILTKKNHCIRILREYFYFSETIRIEEVFIGYNKDTAAGVVLKAWEICSKNSMEENDSLQHVRIFKIEFIIFLILILRALHVCRRDIMNPCLH